MSSSHRGRFEHEWMDAFKDASCTPSEGLWDKIDHDLTVPQLKSENNQLKRRLFLIYWTVAAGVAFAAVAGSVALYTGNSGYSSSLKDKTISGLVLQEKLDNSMAENNQLDNQLNSNQNSEFNTNGGVDSPNLEKNRNAEQYSGSIGDDSNHHGVERNDRVATLKIRRKSLLPLVNTPNTVSLLPEIKKDMLVYGNSDGGTKIIDLEIGTGGMNLSQSELMVADGKGMDYNIGEFPEIEGVFDYKHEFVKVESKERLWAGITLGGGVYENSGISGINMDQSLAYAGTDASSKSSSYYKSELNGTTQGMGLILGKKLTDRFSFMGGLGYSTITSGLYQGNFSVTGMSMETATKSLSTSDNVMEGYLQEDRFSFISVPARLGVSLLDRKFGIAIYSGIDSRIYVNSSTNQYQQGTKNYNYQDRNINPVTFWGGVNTEFTYNFSENYKISVTPGYKIVLNELEKGSGDHPSLADVGVALKYVFK
ncbi:MAG: hypothetical protein OEW75_12060 [Cyclobacteriaceae bacterium]|nr:hypothetical protein [Cyclobacteriaceae bacterium]